MAVSHDSIKQLRERTGAGVMDCKRALEEAEGDLARAEKIIAAQGIARAEKRADRVATAGVIEAYIHHDRRLGALVELNCETDLVARTDLFRELARNIAMQVASTSPRYLTKDEVPADDQEQVKELALLEQPFIKEPGKSISQLITETSAKTGEKVALRRFSRFQLGVE